MSKVYQLSTQAVYANLRAAEVALGIGGLSSENCADYGLVIPAIADEPSLNAGQRAVRNTLPTETSPGVWAYQWAVEDIPATAEMVKGEAYRRIVALCPEWRQRNLTAQAAQLAKKGEANWTAEEATAWAAGEALWAQIAAIRAASDIIEAMDPIPTDFAADDYWS